MGEKYFRNSLDRRSGRAVSIFYYAYALEEQGKVLEAGKLYRRFLERWHKADSQSSYKSHANNFLLSMVNETSVLSDVASPLRHTTWQPVAPQLGTTFPLPFLAAA